MLVRTQRAAGGERTSEGQHAARASPPRGRWSGAWMPLGGAEAHPAVGPSREGQGEGDMPERRTRDCHLKLSPGPVTHLPWLQLADRNPVPLSWAISTFGMGRDGAPASPFPPARPARPTAAAHPDPGAATAASPVPPQRSTSGYACKDNSSTGVQLPLPHHTPATVSLRCFTAFPHSTCG